MTTRSQVGVPRRYAAAACFVEAGDFGAEPSSAFYDFEERAGRVKEEERRTGFFSGWRNLDRAA